MDMISYGIFYLPVTTGSRNTILSPLGSVILEPTGITVHCDANGLPLAT